MRPRACGPTGNIAAGDSGPRSPLYGNFAPKTSGRGLSGDLIDT